MTGICECGCGEFTRVATRDEPRWGWVKGVPRRFLSGHNRRLVPRDPESYPRVSLAGESTRIHRIRAERALGKPLPKGAQVHHANGTRDSGPLVICQDVAYHRLLHARMRVRDAGGNPNTDKICGACEGVFDKSRFSKDPAHSDGLAGWCMECAAAWARAYRARSA